MIIQEENSSTIKIAFFIAVATIYYFLRKPSGDYSIQKPVVEVAVILLFWSLSSFWIWISRYNMPHVTSNNFNGSILGRPVVLKDINSVEWLVFNTGDHLEPIYGPGKLATLILPKNGTYRAGKNYVSRTFVSKTPINFLPPIVFRYLYHNQNNYNTENIFFGKFAEESIDENKDTPKYEHLIQNLNSQVNERDKIIERDNDTLVEMKKMAEEVTGQKQSWWKGLFAKKETQENE